MATPKLEPGDTWRCHISRIFRQESTFWSDRVLLLTYITFIMRSADMETSCERGFTRSDLITAESERNTNAAPLCMLTVRTYPNFWEEWELGMENRAWGGWEGNRYNASGENSRNLALLKKPTCFGFKALRLHVNLWAIFFWLYVSRSFLLKIG